MTGAQRTAPKGGVSRGAFDAVARGRPGAPEQRVRTVATGGAFGDGAGGGGTGVFSCTYRASADTAFGADPPSARVCACYVITSHALARIAEQLPRAVRWPDSALGALCAAASPRIIDQGTPLWAPGDAAESFVVVVRGACRVDVPRTPGGARRGSGGGPRAADDPPPSPSQQRHGRRRSNAFCFPGEAGGDGGAPQQHHGDLKQHGGFFTPPSSSPARRASGAFVGTEQLWVRIEDFMGLGLKPEMHERVPARGGAGAVVGVEQAPPIVDGAGLVEETVFRELPRTTRVVAATDADVWRVPKAAVADALREDAALFLLSKSTAREALGRRLARAALRAATPFVLDAGDTLLHT
eukprot:gene53250-34179_t